MCEGVEGAKADCESNKLTVTGKVDPTRLRERLEYKTKKKVELLSPQPKKDGGAGAGSGGDKKSDEKKPDEKKGDDKKPKQEVFTILSSPWLITKVVCIYHAWFLNFIFTDYIYI